MERVDQAGTPTPRLDGEPAPELEFAVDLEGLAAVDGHETHALRPQPLEGRVAAPNQELDEVRAGAVLGDPRHVVEELVLAVGPEIGVAPLLLGEVGHQLEEVLDPIVGDADGAGREGRVAAALLDGCPLER